MEAPDKILSLAYEYRKVKIWKCLYGRDIFAIQMKDGEIAYISIFGSYGEDYSLNLYIGEEGIYSFVNISSKMENHEIEAKEAFFEQKMLHFTLENSETLDYEELENIRRFKRKHNIKIGGSNSFPMFNKFDKYKIPWPVADKKDWSYLEQAIAACLDLNDEFRKNKFDYFSWTNERDFDKEIPLFKLKDGKYTFDKKIKIPKVKEIFYEAKNLNELQIKRIKSFPKMRQIDCKIVFIPDPIQLQPGEAPVFSHMIFALNDDTKMILASEPTVNYTKNPKEMVNNLMDAMVHAKINPKTIRVDDERTYTILKTFSKKIGANLLYVPKLEAIWEAIEDFHSKFYSQQNMPEGEINLTEEDIFFMLNEFSDTEIENFPPEIVLPLKKLHEEGLLPEDISQRLDRLGL